MVKIFDAECPRCGGVFHCHYADLRHTEWQLHCPYCDHEFKQEESPKIKE